MEQVRDAKLDNFCEAIAEDRRTMNRARVDEQSNIQGALQQMVRKGQHAYRHGGVELSRVPGAEKLRVRLTKEEGDAGDADFVPAEGGEGSDAGEFGEEPIDALEDAGDYDEAEA